MSERGRIVVKTGQRWQLYTMTKVGDVSTVELPIVGHPGGDYETCIFFKDGDSEVVERYETKDEAAKGHARHVEARGGEQSTGSRLFERLRGE